MSNSRHVASSFDFISSFLFMTSLKGCGEVGAEKRPTATRTTEGGEKYFVSCLSVLYIQISEQSCRVSMADTGPFMMVKLRHHCLLLMGFSLTRSACVDCF